MTFDKIYVKMKSLKKNVAAWTTLCVAAAFNPLYAMPASAGQEGNEPMVAVPVASQAKITVQGTVLDETGIPVVGANVVVAGTTHGVITDIDGNFTLQDVDEHATLVISYIGYQTMEIKAGTSLQIVLKEDAELLDEVVVVGYGTMRRKDVTSSISTIQSDDLNQGVYTDPAQLLQGKVAGLTITQSSDP